MPEKKFTHLKMCHRRTIEDRLREGVCIGEIATEIGFSWNAVANEIKRRRVSESTHYQHFDRNLCRHRDECAKTDACGTGCFNRCSRCAGAACVRVCGDYAPAETWPRLQKAPYACNGCKMRLGLSCRHANLFYDADIANREAEWDKATRRQGIDCSPEELEAMVKVVKPLLKKGQSLSRIWQAHHGEFPVGVRTFYRYVEYGVLDICNLELSKKVKCKPRKKPRAKDLPFRSVYAGRTCADFQELSEERKMSAVEMDCVLGKGSDGKAILALHFRRLSFQLIITLPAHSAGCVKRALGYIELICGTKAYAALFGTILTDRGTEFSNPEALGTGVEGVKRGEVYYFATPCNRGRKALVRKITSSYAKFCQRALRWRRSGLTSFQSYAPT